MDLSSVSLELTESESWKEAFWERYWPEGLRSMKNPREAQEQAEGLLMFTPTPWILDSNCLFSTSLQHLRSRAGVAVRDEGGLWTSWRCDITILNLEQLSHLSMDDLEWEEQKVSSLHACADAVIVCARDVPEDLSTS